MRRLSHFSARAKAATTKREQAENSTNDRHESPACFVVRRLDEPSHGACWPFWAAWLTHSLESATILTMTVRELLEAIRALPQPDRLQLVEQLSRELVDPPVPLTHQQDSQMDPLSDQMEQRGRLLVYTGHLPDPALDHRVDREERIDHQLARLDVGRI